MKRLGNHAILPEPSRTLSPRAWQTATVVIGANMPSVLAESSFIPNPSDEQWLKKPESRQRVAEGLYRGIETYLQNTNSLSLNQTHPAPGNRSGIVARSGNPQ